MRDQFERYEVPLAVAIGGAFGSLGRWGMSLWSGTADFPAGTLVANLVGCFLLGMVLVVGEVFGRRGGHHHGHPPAWVRLWRPFMATGVLGGFTTFSALVVEVHELDAAVGVGYLILSLGAGIGCYALGNGLARRWFQVHA